MSHTNIFTVIAIRHDALPEYSELVYPVHIQGECLRRQYRLRRQYQELCSETFYHDKKRKIFMTPIRILVIDIIVIICISDISDISDIILRKCYNRNNSK